MIEYADLIGVPFKHKGRTLDGFDCWGLVLYVLRRHGKQVDDPVPDYPENWKDDKTHNYFLEHYHKQWERIDKPEILDVVLFGQEKDFPTHIGILVETDKVLHISEKHRTIISRPSYIKKAVYGYYRFIGS